MSFSCYREGAEEDEDFVGNAESDFWNVLSQEKKDIEAKEEKRREAMMPNQPTPIPEEGEERRDSEDVEVEVTSPGGPGESQGDTVGESES